MKNDDRKPRIRPKFREKRSNCGFCTCRSCPENAAFLVKAEEIGRLAESRELEKAREICEEFLKNSEKYRKNDVFYHNFHLKLLENHYFKGSSVRDIILEDLPKWAYYHEKFVEALE